MVLLLFWSDTPHAPSLSGTSTSHARPARFPAISPLMTRRRSVRSGIPSKSDASDKGSSLFFIFPPAILSSTHVCTQRIIPSGHVPAILRQRSGRQRPLSSLIPTILADSGHFPAKLKNGSRPGATLRPFSKTTWPIAATFRPDPENRRAAGSRPPPKFQRPKGPNPKNYFRRQHRAPESLSQPAGP